MRKILSLLLTVVLILWLCPAVCASESFVIDNAGILTSSQAAALNEKAEDICDTYGIAAVISTEDSLSGSTAQMHAESLYYDLYSDAYPSCIIFVICMESREWSIQTWNQAAELVTDWEIDDIMDDILSDLSGGSYYHAFDVFLDRVAQECEFPGSNTEAEELGWFQRLLIALAIGAVIAGIALLIMRSQMNTAKTQSGAQSYMIGGSYDLYRRHDIYLYSRTTKVRRQQSSSGGGGGRSSGGRSNGGHSRGGRSGRF